MLSPIQRHWLHFICPVLSIIAEPIQTHHWVTASNKLLWMLYLLPFYFILFFALCGWGITWFAHCVFSKSLAILSVQKDRMSAVTPQHTCRIWMMDLNKGSRVQINFVCAYVSDWARICQWNFYFFSQKTFVDNYSTNRCRDGTLCHTHHYFFLHFLSWCMFNMR